MSEAHNKQAQAEGGRPMIEVGGSSSCKSPFAYAKRIGATTTEIKSSHVPFLSHPRDVAKVIEAAATAPTVRATQ